MNDLARRLLHDLGILVTPTTLVALFCAAIGVDPQRTAIYSIASVLFVACCYYRSWISANVPSALVLAVAVGLGTIFVVNYGDILLKDTGLIRRYPESSAVLGDLGAEIRRANHEIWFFGTNFHVSAVDQRPLVLEKLKQGVRVRYLFLNPTVPNLQLIADDFGQPLEELRQECLKGLRDVLELQKRWQLAGSPGELQIRVYDRTPSARMYVFDPDSPTGHSIYVPYMHGFNSPNLPAYLFENTETGVARAYLAGLTRMWNTATPVESMLQKIPEFAATPAVANAGIGGETPRR
jgi:hypothetical protein